MGSGGVSVRPFAEESELGYNASSSLGQTDAGRYLSVFFVYKKSHDAIVISARDQDAGERREYGKA